MDKEGQKSKTFVSTFRLVLKPKASTLLVVKQKNDGLDTKNRTLTGSSNVEVSSSTGKSAPSHNPLRRNGVASQSQCSTGDAGTHTCRSDSAAERRPTSADVHIIATREIPATNKQLHQGLKSAEVKAWATRASREKSQQDENYDITERRRQAKASAKKEPPVQFLNPPEQVEVRVGERARLHCEFRSSSVPVACCWIYNRDKVVETAQRVSVRSSETQSSVEISGAGPADGGSYTIVVRNKEGTANHTVSLTVIDRPDPPASQPVVSQLTSVSLVLSWTGPSYDGGKAVQGYIVEVRPEGLGKTPGWTELATRCKSTSYHVRSGLDPLGRYRFRVRAYNSAGISEPSQESECVKMATTRVSRQHQQLASYDTITINSKHRVTDHYNVHEKLGVGKFGEVFRLSHKETGQVCAGKFYRARTAKDRAAARKEIELMNCLHHPKLVQCLAAYDARAETVMVLEYIAGGELFERLVDDNFEHTELTSARYMRQILQGMEYVHKQNIVHLDLKPENIVCVDTTGTQIKIIDFGLASKLEDNKPLMVMHGTPEFVAPEVISYEPVGLETDMWSIGVICFILLSGESPFQGNSDTETLALVTEASYEFDEESFEDISEQAKDFIRSLLKKDRRCRLSCTEALVHPWMISFTPLTRCSTKSLNKDKMRRFLAKRKWKKTGKAVLALQRMANLSNRPESPGSSSEEPGWSQEAEEAIESLDKQLRSEPRFRQALRDTIHPTGATARLTCIVNGYPQPTVQWLQNGNPVTESSRTTMEEEEDGLCALVLADLNPSDSGIYTCKASNKQGEATCSAKLKVEM
ncbi:myosin light chain kinase, smooth muscle-like [Takifugu flavidus]|uniref:myosin light chain kinase, smooth muscle-like n=1 Tax=Takifugu flavidus TaxID=433684 RepID=UPI0025442966|nr:myosin light chain kinase, smooth muscle-like [Takifugu flavidus]